MTLADAEQQRLYEWLDAQGGRVRVITTSHEPLYPMVVARTFLEPLYYRLNIVCVDCLGSNAPAAGPMPAKHG